MPSPNYAPPVPVGARHSRRSFIRLAWSIDAGEPIERPAIVACRYTEEDC